MKRNIFAAVCAVAALALGACMLTSCGGGSSAPAPKAEDKTLIVGFDADYPPYGFLADKGAEGYEADGNTYTGFDLDLANEVCQRNGWTLQVMPIDWDAKDQLLESGQINCIWNGFTKEGREDGYTFSDPYMLNAQVVVTKAGSDIVSADDLAGKSVITQADSAALALFDGEDAVEELVELSKSFKGGAITTIKDYNQAFMQLESGAVDAVACDLSVAMTQMNAKPDAFQQLGDNLSEEHYAVGFKKGDEETAAAVNETLKAMDDDGTVKKIAEKYGEDIDYANLWCLGK